MTIHLHVAPSTCRHRWMLYSLFAHSITCDTRINANVPSSKWSIVVPSSKWSAELLVKGMFYFLEACKREFHALFKYYVFVKIFCSECCLKLLFISAGACLFCLSHLDRFGGFSAFRSGPLSGRPTVVLQRWDRCQAKFLTSHQTRMHRVIFCIPNT